MQRQGADQAKEAVEDRGTLHPPLILAVERYPSQNIYSLLQISLSWTELEALYLQKNKIYRHQPPLLRPWCSMNVERSPL